MARNSDRSRSPICDRTRLEKGNVSNSLSPRSKRLMRNHHARNANSRSRSLGRHRPRSPPDAQNRERDEAAEETLESKEKAFPGVTLLFNEPADARKPDIRWRLYVFKGGEVLTEPLYVHRQSCYLFGRERRVADIPTDHPSCSKQHAVLQYRQVEEENPDGTMSKRVRPYLMDLGSTNGTSINENQIEAQRYYELFEKDTVKFAGSMFYCTRIQLHDAEEPTIPFPIDKIVPKKRMHLNVAERTVPFCEAVISDQAILFPFG